MKGKKILALLTSALLCVSLLAGCGGQSAPGESEPSSENPVESMEPVQESTQPEQPAASTDPLEMITEGYYSFTYPVEGMDDMCAFFHFYPEQPVLGAVFYAGFAWNQITYVGTYTVEQKDMAYKCTATREDGLADPPNYTEGTAAYTVTFYDFDGNELGACGFDGGILYNDSPIAGTGAENCFFYHDADPASKYLGTYEGEVGQPYLDFVAAEEVTSTLTLYHNGRYLDMVDMMVEGTWSMAEAADGYEYTLTPDSDSDTAAVIAVSADESAGVYTPEGGAGINMINTADSGPQAMLEMIGTAPIPGQEVDADVIGKLYDDGSVTVIASAFGSEFPLDEGTWSMGEDGYTVSFQFKNAGELASELGEAGAVLKYVVSSEVLGEVDTELVISFAASSAPSPEYTMAGQAPMGENLTADVTGTLYSDGSVIVHADVLGTGMDIDQGTWTMDNFVFTFQFDNAGELVSEFGDAGAVLKYYLASEAVGVIDAELVLAAAE
ncbi:MAG: hypothetical protein NC432_03820 [Roseburia sp.]|nr:hypothetical protein [Roseburia sp.]MCM1098473.1 hypothetical protein [Ruminococcus flavefaciens]